MKKTVIIILIAIVIVFLIIRVKKKENEEEIRKLQLLSNIEQFGLTSVQQAQAQQNVIQQFINSPFITETSGIFGSIWGLIV